MREFVQCIKVLFIGAVTRKFKEYKPVDIDVQWRKS